MTVCNAFRSASAGRRPVTLMSALALALAGTSAAATPTASATSKCDRFLANTISKHVSSGWSSVIVKLHGADAIGQTKQLKALGADIYRHLPVVRSVAVHIPSRNLARLAALPFVERLSTDAPVQKCDQFTIASSGAATAWQSPYNVSGAGVTVAIVDSGIQPVPDVNSTGLLGTGLLSTSRILQKVSFVAGDSSTDDKCGHGTHVAGIVGGNGMASSGLTCFRTFYGVAPKTNLVNVRVLNGVGEGTVSQVIAGIQWVVSHKAAYKIRVMNLSMGHPVGESYTTDPLCQAVEQAWKAGIVVVCAAGNSGRIQNTPDPSLSNEGYGTAYGTIQSPGNDPYVITVGATKSIDGNRAHDRIATYSSRGPSRVDLVLKPDIIAPGNQVISLLANGSYLDAAHSSTNQIPWSYYTLSLGGNSTRYFRLSGTSMAAPVVAGAAALMLQANPNLSPDTIKARLMISADKWADPAGNTDPCTYGAGYLNIPSALNSSVVATQYAMSPSLSEDSAGNVYINMDGTIWSTRAIWGTDITDLRAIWGTDAIAAMSANTLNASRAIWGTTVWTDRAIWGTDSGAVDLSSIAVNGE